MGAAIAVAAVAALAATRLVTIGTIRLLDPISTGTFAATAAIAAIAYRDRRDPALLFMAVGTGAFATQYLLWHVVTPNVWTAVRIGVPVYLHGAILGGFAGTLALACCLALVAPWRERRGRTPIRWQIVVASVAIPLVLFDVALVAARPAIPIPAVLGRGFQAGVLTPLLLGMAIAGAAVAVVRTFGRPGWYRWIVGAACAVGLAAVGTLVSYVVDNRSLTYVAVTWETMLPATAAALALGGVIATNRADVSRMRRATDRATEVMEGRAEIASVVAHDVRGPASAIKSIAASARSNYERLNDAERLEFVGMIEREAARLLQVVNQMSLALKVDAGSLEYHRRTQQLGPIVVQAVHDAELTERPVDVDTSVFVAVEADERWLAEAIGQGIDNADRFSPAGAPIQVHVSANDEDAEIRIEDSGPGIPAEEREEVFQKFARWRPAGYEDTPGSGLGLYICRSIVRELGGDAILGSGAAGGTILRIRLPRKG